MTSPVDYTALAEQAAAANVAANVRYQQALQDSQLSAFAALVYTAAAAELVTVDLEPSDQGDWMTVSAIAGSNSDAPDVDEDALEDGAHDLPDTIHSHWATLPGVTYTSDRRYGDKASIDIPTAVEALLAKPETAGGHGGGEEMVGKTVASVTTSEEQVRDTYKDEYTIERTLLTFTDGTQATFGEVQMDLYSID